MIGKWDNKGCVLALAPGAYGNSNDGKGSFNVGNFPSYPGGASQPCALTNMGAGFGYVYNGKGGVFRFDGVADIITTGTNFVINDAANLTIEFWINYQTTGATQYVFRQRDDNNNLMYMFISAAQSFAFTFVKATVVQRVRAGGPQISVGWNHVACVKNGAVLNILVNGEYLVYIEQDAYTHGDLGVAANFEFGIGLGATLLADDVSWLAIYGDTYTQEQARHNYRLGKTMGLKGVSDEATMRLYNYRNNKSSTGVRA